MHLKIVEASSRQRDKKIISLIRNLRKMGYKVAFATNTEKEVAEFNKKRKDNFFALFENGFASTDVGLNKQNPKFFIEALRKLKIKGEDAVFIDNEGKYAESAKKSGLKAVLYGK